MTRSRFATAAAAALGGFATAWAGSAAAKTAFSAEGATGSFLTLLTERLEFTLKQFPALGQHLANLPDIVGGRTALLLLAIVVAGLVAEYIARLLLSRARLRGFDRLVGHSPLRAFGLAVLLDVVALIALAVAGRLVLAQLGDPQSLPGKLGQQVFQALVYWRAFNLLFRAWLRPSTPEGRIAPVDDATARGLLVALNWVVVLPLIGGHVARPLQTTGASRDCHRAAGLLHAARLSAGRRWRP